MSYDDAGDGRRVRDVVDVINSIERERAEPIGSPTPGRRVQMVKPLPSIAARLVIMSANDTPTTNMVALMSRDGLTAQYLAQESRMLNGRPIWKAGAAAASVALSELGVELQMSGRTGGGVYFYARVKQTRVIQTPRGPLAWSFNPKWVRLAAHVEQEVVP